MINNQELTQLSNELTYHRYMFTQGQAAGLFKDISVPEYVALHCIFNSVSQKSDGAQRTYLKDIAEELHLSIPKTSAMIGALRDKGLISWGHDGNGSDGTYVSVTESGAGLVERQEAVLKNYYGRVIEKFGEKKLVALFSLMEELESVMDRELNEKGEDD